MSQEFEQQPVPPMPKSSSGVNGCLIGCAIVAAVGVIGVALVTYAVYRGAMGTLDATTETAPRELPPLELSADEQAASEAKFKQLKAALEGSGDQKEFALTGNDINVMLRSDPEVRALGESVYVTIAAGEVRGEVSLDLGTVVPVSFLKGRYLNGSATFSVSASDGRLFVFVENFQFKGDDVSSEVLQQLRNQNLAQDIKDPEFKEFIAKIEEIRVDEDKLVITLK